MKDKEKIDILLKLRRHYIFFFVRMQAQVKK